MTQESYFQAPPTPPRMRSNPFAGTESSLALRVKALEETLLDIGHYGSMVAEVANGARRGKLSSIGSVTLTANAATTTLLDKNIAAQSKILLVPTTIDAAGEWGSGTMYVSAKTKESATITHTNSSGTNRVFDYFVVG